MPRSVTDNPLVFLDGLTPDLLQKHFPVARSIRRTNKDLFAPWIDGADLRDDAKFYPVLLRIIKEAPETIIQFDERMEGAKDGRKQFAIRAFLRLLEAGVAEREVTTLWGLPPDHYPAGSLERIFHRLLLHLNRTAETVRRASPMPPDKSGTKTPSVEPDGSARETQGASTATVAKWQTLARQLAGAAAALDTPDAVRAASLCDLAQRLLVACEESAQARTDEARTRHLAALADRIRALGLEMPPDRLGVAPPDTIEALERDVAQLEAADAALAELRSEDVALKDRKKAADEAEDYAKLEALLPDLQRARLALKAANALCDERRNACLTALTQLTALGEPNAADAVDARPSPRPGPQEDARSQDEPAEAYSGETISAGGTEVARDPPQPTEEPATRPAVPAPPVSEEPREDASLLAHYLASGETALAYHLTALAEARGEEPPVAACLLEALVHGATVERADHIADGPYQKLLAEAMDAVEVAEAGRSPEHAAAARSLALAALLRPALFDFNRTARTHLGRISLVNELQALAPLVTVLVSQGFDVQPTIEDIDALNGHDQERRTPAASRALHDWLTTNRHARTSHQPTYSILHWLLDPAGDIGAIVEAALRDDAEAPGRCRALIDRLADPAAIVAEAQHILERPRRDRIEGLALNWIVGRLSTGRERISAWLAAKELDSAVRSDRQQETLRRETGKLAKSCADLLSLPAPTGTGLVAAAQQVLRRTIEDFELMLRGGGQPRRLRDRNPLRTVLLRLPALCLPHWLDDNAFADERDRQRHELQRALERPGIIAPDIERAFNARLAEQATAAAGEILALLEAEGMPSPSSRQALDEAIDAARSRAKDRVQRLRQDLATLLNLDAGAGGDVWERLHRLDGILAALGRTDGGGIPVHPGEGPRTAALPPDFPELACLLDGIEAYRDDLRQRIRTDQLTRLKAIAGDGKMANAAGLVIERAADRDPVTLDDMIADLEAGRDPLALDDAGNDLFGAFFPTFVEAFQRQRPVPTLGRLQEAAAQRKTLGILDFSKLEETAATRGASLIDAWAKLAAALQTRRSDRLVGPLSTLLGLIGFTSTKVVPERILMPGVQHALQLSFDTPRPDRWFLPPEFGSGARGKYRLLVVAPEVDPNQLASTIGSAPDQPWLILQTGRLDKRGRESIARAMRQNRRAAIVLDEVLLLHMAASGGDPLERLITCGSPFAYIQPYTTNPRNIPAEMFFGRREEIQVIASRAADGCLIYGGRQLGKSALLNQIQRNMHRPDDGQIAIHLDIVDIGEEPVDATEIWSRMTVELGKAGVAVPKAREAERIIGGIRSWLDGNPTRRILLMFDEADQFLAAEHPAYPNLRRLKDLMETTDWRFKSVFAGLHNVRRLAEAPNSPLVHLGEPVCVGPMNTSTDNRRELRRLATQPLAAAGFTYDPPELAADILARVNHYPSLVQVFCKEIIGLAHDTARVPGSGPRWTLDRATLFEGGIASRIAAEIRKRFQWTLDLDPRYDLIAKCLALHRLDDADGHLAVLRDGMTVDEISSLTEPWRPANMQPLMRGDLRALLDEMHDLGVLGRKAAGRYGLRNAQVAQMMGQRAAIEEEILALAEREAKADYDAAIYHRRANPANPDSLSPLTDRQLARLLDAREQRICFVTAPPALWGADVPERLAEIARHWDGGDGHPPEVLVVHDKTAPLRERLEGRRDRPLVAILDMDWHPPTYTWLLQRPELRTGLLRPIWIIPTRKARPRMPETKAAAWIEAPLLTDGMLRHWLRAAGLSRLDERPMRQALIEHTGGIPARLSALRPVLVEQAERRQGELGDAIREWSHAHPFEPSGLELETATVTAFREVAQLLDGDAAPLTEADIRDGLPAFASCLPEALTAGLLEADAGDRLRLTPLGRLIARSR